jgi:hypothetical protein
MAEYCTDDDLVELRPDILNLGVSGWDEQIEEAGKVIDRALQAKWYKAQADEYGLDWREEPFDRDKLLNAAEQLTRLGTYKSLELAYLHLMKNQVEDAFRTQMLLFQKLYARELEEVLLAGLDYDWDASGALASSETLAPRIRRLERC